MGVDNYGESAIRKNHNNKQANDDVRRAKRDGNERG